MMLRERKQAYKVHHECSGQSLVHKAITRLVTERKASTMLLLVFRITASTLVAHSYYSDFKMGEASKWNCLPPNTPTKEGHAQIKNQETTSSCLEYMVSTLGSLCWTPLSHILICSHPACPVRARHSLKQLRMAQNLKRGGGGGGVGGGATPPPPICKQNAHGKAA